ncbi:glycoside hydrolase family 36 protein [Robinsoniella sp. KNHs210]|uniref:glycoside hydrolase family 36 protein n=1 Tax=Robinsoniella sp. KNHs210 TaxID=1469950 RepID=UPI000487DCBE|nr:glycoside hydrolase family 36 protein [Robinsoniella sp. KNHs210]
MIQILEEYLFGDMTARYVTDQKKEKVGLILLPASEPAPADIEKKQEPDSLVQIKVAGDTYGGAYSQGSTLRNSQTVQQLKFWKQEHLQEEKKQTVVTSLKDERGYVVRHFLTWTKGDLFCRSFCEFENNSGEAAELEMFESFSLGGISPYIEGDCHDQIVVHRLRSRWSQEGRLESLPIERLELEPAWADHAVRCERFGQAGSMPVNKFFPYLVLEDRKNHIFWGAQIAHGASWQMEIYRKDEGIAMSGGLADREFGHWMKIVEAGACFQTPQAILSVGKCRDIDDISYRLTKSGEEGANQAPEAEQDLPIVFNEYCTTWGCPSHKNISSILEAVKGKGFTYFVIDCGWYKEEGVPWDISMGDYEVSADLFPEGLAKTVNAIKEAGLQPGIWFEIENTGRASKAYQMTEHLLKRDGKVLTTDMRRFWDMQDPWVEAYLTERVIGTLKKYGFTYMKIDYNDTIGIGCDGAESQGEALRQKIEATMKFLEKIKAEVPGIVLENCASGGHRLEPGFMQATSMASFSDAHECVEIPIIAANLHRCILPRQSQIWAVIRKEDSLKRIAYSVANTFLGRMCISGDVTNLNEGQWEVIDSGITFYKKIAKIIKNGKSFRFGPDINSVRNPEGWQGLLRTGEEENAYIVLHTFGGVLPETIQIPLPDDRSWELADIYSDTSEVVSLKERTLSYQPAENFKAVAILLKCI